VTIFVLIPKLAIFYVLSKLLYTIFPIIFTLWSPILYIIGILSIILGALGGLNQTSFLRLLAYSTITDMGYVFVSLSFGDIFAFHAALVYFLIHTLSSLTIFSFFANIHSQDKHSIFNNINDFSFLKTQHYLQITPLIGMISYMSIPPLAGFFGKTYIFGILIFNKEYFVLLLLCIAFFASTFFYSRIIRNFTFYSEYQITSFIENDDLSYIDIFLIAIFNITFILFINHFVIYTIFLTQNFLA
jgi:NADH-quinone oxidoreductase subunit N